MKSSRSAANALDELNKIKNDLDQEVRKETDLARANRHLQDRIKKMEDGLEAFERIVAEVVSPLPKWEPPKGAKKSDKHTSETLVAMFSDTQIGSRISSASTSGLGGWDRKDFPRMLDLWGEKLSTILGIQRADHPVDRMVITGLGDYVEGEDIYRGQTWNLDMDLLEQITWGSDMFAKKVLDLACTGKFKDGIDLVMIPGNHGRLGRPGQIRANADDLFIAFLSRRLAASKAIRVFHSKSPLMIFQIYGKWNFLMTHGNETNAWMGIPYYGLERDGLKQMAMTRVPIHYKLAGHHHRPAEMDLGPEMILMINGCWPGPTDFSVNAMKSAVTPKQWAFFMHPRVGRTAMYDIRLGEVPSLSADENGIFTPLRKAGC